MNNTIKTLALITATIGVATVVKRKKEQPAGTGHSRITNGDIFVRSTDSKLFELKDNGLTQISFKNDVEQENLLLETASRLISLANNINQKHQ